MKLTLIATIVKIERTGSVSCSRLHGSFYWSGSVNLQDFSTELVQVHIVDRILSIRGRRVCDEGKATMFRFCWRCQRCMV